MTTTAESVPQAPMFRLLSSETQPLTHELAEWQRDLKPSPTERELDPARLRHLREKASAGQLINFYWATAKLGNEVMRMNGQHSSVMLAELNGAFPEGLRVHLDHYEVDDKNGLAVLFRQFDDRKSGRSTSDVSGAYQGLHENLHIVPRATAKLGIDGIAWWRRHVEGLPVPQGDNVYSLFGETALHSFLIWIGEVFTIKTPELRKPSIVAAMYATFNAGGDDAQKFWNEVSRGGVEYEDNHPTTVLDTWLKAIKEGENQRLDLKPANYYQGCIYAWNASREGKSIKDIKFDIRKGLHPVA